MLDWLLEQIDNKVREEEEIANQLRLEKKVEEFREARIKKALEGFQSGRVNKNETSK